MKRGAGAAAILAVGLALAGCGEAERGTEWTGTVSDSAGVSIIANPASGMWTDAARWSAVEELRIGVETGDPELQFGMITGLDVDDEGRIYVLDAQAARVRIFSPEGELVHAFGRPGGGPGELSALAAGFGGAIGLFLTSDGNLLIPDMGNFRIARFTREGEPLASRLIDIQQGIPMLWAVSSQRTVHQQVRRMAVPGMPAIEGGPRDYILRLGPDGTVADTLAVLAAGQTLEMGAGGMRIRFFSPETVWTLDSDGNLVTGLNSEYSMNLWGADRSIATILRREFTRRPVTEREKSDMLRVLREAWEDAGLPEAAANMMLQNVEFEENWPALNGVLGGPDGTLWVQRVDPTRALEITDAADLQALQLGSEDWDVFDREGRFLGAITMPEGFVPRRVLGDRIYGIHQDALEVQRVMRIRIEGIAPAGTGM